jgi:HAD superfamily hydrolase (TIGR01509 family)
MVSLPVGGDRPCTTGFRAGEGHVSFVFGPIHDTGIVRFPAVLTMVDWNQIRSVFLDMDGTLLDLHFDTHFWCEYVPQRYAERYGLDPDVARDELLPRFRAVEGTMNWYCVDYWTRELGLDIALLKLEVDHLIDVHPYVPEFLEKVRLVGKRVVLVTNAHQKSLALKMERTQLAGHFDAVICSHDFGRPKEDPHFWEQLQGRERFDPTQTLLVDDSLPVLRSAGQYGIAHLLAVRKPDTRNPPKETEEFEAIETFRDIMPGEMTKDEG